MEKIDIFLSSPRDLRPERRIAEQVVQNLRQRDYISQSLTLHALAWETEVPAEVGNSPQHTVDRYMRADRCAIVVCILWQRIGTPVVEEGTGERFESGTEYEFIHAYRAREKTGRPTILLYRMMRPVQPDVDLKQLARVQKFFHRFEGEQPVYKGLPKPVISKRDFERVLTRDLEKILDERRRQAGRPDYYGHVALPLYYVSRRELIGQDAPAGRRHNEAAGCRRVGRRGEEHDCAGDLRRCRCATRVPRRDSSPRNGQQPNLREKLAALLHGLGGTPPGNNPDEQTLRSECGKRLASRSCLLVLDNVWEKGDAEAFRFDALKCRMLLTTRDEAMARRFGAAVYGMPTMSVAEAVSLLVQWAAPREIDLGAAEEIVNRVGRSPMAIRLAGAELQTEAPAEWLSDFDAASAGESQTLSRSIDVLGPEEQRVYFALAIFPKSEPIPVMAIEHLWKSLAGFDSSSTAALLDNLDSRGLLEKPLPRSYRRNCWDVG
jgi:hypothetical protein